MISQTSANNQSQCRLPAEPLSAPTRFTICLQKRVPQRLLKKTAKLSRPLPTKPPQSLPPFITATRELGLPQNCRRDSDRDRFTPASRALEERPAPAAPEKSEQTNRMTCELAAKLQFGARSMSVSSKKRCPAGAGCQRGSQIGGEEEAPKMERVRDTRVSTEKARSF
jgi:hypothetical protein